MDISTIEDIAHEMDTVALLVGSIDSTATARVADVAPGLYGMLRRWAATIERVSGSAYGIDAPSEEYSVLLTREEADHLRARAAAHGVTPEGELLALVDAAIQRHRGAEGDR